MKPPKVLFPLELYSEIRRDLSAAHPYAFERVGFLFCGYFKDSNLLRPRAYLSVADGDYLCDDSVGACIGSKPIKETIHRALDRQESVFHVHVHEHRGQPAFSRTDSEMLKELIPALGAVSPASPHGGMLFSEDLFLLRAWMPDGRIVESREVHYERE